MYSSRSEESFGQSDQDTIQISRDAEDQSNPYSSPQYSLFCGGDYSISHTAKEMEYNLQYSRSMWRLKHETLAWASLYAGKHPRIGSRDRYIMDIGMCLICALKHPNLCDQDNILAGTLCNNTLP